jgi:hypothetical protein
MLYSWDSNGENLWIIIEFVCWGLSKIPNEFRYSSGQYNNISHLNNLNLIHHIQLQISKN